MTQLITAIHGRKYSGLISPKEVASEYDISVHTQNIWRFYNRYGWRDITIRVGRKVAYRRDDIEKWLESRRGLVGHD